MGKVCTQKKMKRGNEKSKLGVFFFAGRGHGDGGAVVPSRHRNPILSPPRGKNMKMITREFQRATRAALLNIRATRLSEIHNTHIYFYRPFRLFRLSRSRLTERRWVLRRWPAEAFYQ